MKMMIVTVLLAGIVPRGCLGSGHFLSASIASPLRELARGAFLASWPVTKQPALKHLKDESMQLINEVDDDDCAKKFLCELARKKGPLNWDEELLLKNYDAKVDYASMSLFFNIAVKVGKDKERKCSDVYPRCLMSLKEMLNILRRQGISFEIPGDERDCQVYFLWKKKDKKIKKAIVSSEEKSDLDEKKEVDIDEKKDSDIDEKIETDKDEKKEVDIEEKKEGDKEKVA